VAYNQGKVLINSLHTHQHMYDTIHRKLRKQDEHTVKIKIIILWHVKQCGLIFSSQHSDTITLTHSNYNKILIDLVFNIWTSNPHS